MKNILLQCILFSGLFFCSHKQTPSNSIQNNIHASAALAVTLRHLPEVLGKTAEMDCFDYLEIVIEYPDTTVQRTWRSDITGEKSINRIPAGVSVHVAASIFSEDSIRILTGSVATDIPAGETTMVQIDLEPLYGYLIVSLENVPEQADSAHITVSGPSMESIESPLTLESVITDIPFDTIIDNDTIYDTLRYYFILDTIEYIPTGPGKTVQAHIFNAIDSILYQLQGTVNISEGANTLSTLEVTASPSSVSLSVTIPEFSVAGAGASILGSNLNETGELILSEIMYNSQNSEGSEWLEILNTRDSAISLKDYAVSFDSDTIYLPDISLESGAFYVMGETDSAFVDTNIGSFTLSNSGIYAIDIIDTADTADTADNYLSDRVQLKFDDNLGWPGSENGVSIVLNETARTAQANNSGLAWALAADTIPGTDPVELGTPGY